MSSSGKNPLFGTIATQGKRINTLTRERNRLDTEVKKLTANQDPERNLELWKKAEALAEKRLARIAELDAEILKLQDLMQVEHEARVAAEGQTASFATLLRQQGDTLKQVNEQVEATSRQRDEFARRYERKRVVGKVQRVFEIAALVLVIPALLVVLKLVGIWSEVWAVKLEAVSALSAKEKAEAETKRVNDTLQLRKEIEVADQATNARLRERIANYERPRSELADPHIGVVLQAPLAPPSGSITIQDIPRTAPARSVVDNTEEPIDSQREMNLIRVRKFMNNIILATANASITLDTSLYENGLHDRNSFLRLFRHTKSTTSVSLADALNEVLGEAGLKYVSENCLMEYRVNIIVQPPPSSPIEVVKPTNLLLSFNPTHKKFVEVSVMK